MAEDKASTMDINRSEDVVQILPGIPLLSSHQAGWRNIFFAYYRHPACEIPVHYLRQHTLTICSEVGTPAKIECRLDNQFKRYCFGHGDIIFCPSGVSKWMAWKRENSFALLALEAQLIEQVAYESVKAERIELLPQFNLKDALIQQIVRALKADLESGCSAGRLYGESAAVMLAVHLLKTNAVSGQVIREYQGGLPNYKLCQILEYINEYLAQNIGLAELAEVVGISQYHFARQFKQSMGITPHQYLIRQRVERAKRLLLQGELSIADVAFQCGFANQGHLSHHFKRLLNTTPKAFRKQ